MPYLSIRDPRQAAPRGVRLRPGLPSPPAGPAVAAVRPVLHRRGPSAGTLHLHRQGDRQDARLAAGSPG